MSNLTSRARRFIDGKSRVLFINPDSSLIDHVINGTLHFIRIIMWFKIAININSFSSGKPLIPNSRSQ
jgi:hypothetical protein